MWRSGHRNPNIADLIGAVLFSSLRPNQPGGDLLRVSCSLGPACRSHVRFMSERGTPYSGSHPPSFTSAKTRMVLPCTINVRLVYQYRFWSTVSPGQVPETRLAEFLLAWDLGSLERGWEALDVTSKAFDLKETKPHHGALVAPSYLAKFLARSY